MENDTAEQGHLADDGHAEQANYEPAVIETEHLPAAARLRAFEDEHLGKDAGRINGKIERGVGSPFAKMTPHRQAHHAALEHLVAAEKGMADASVNLAEAEAAHEAAANRAAAAANAADEAA